MFFLLFFFMQRIDGSFGACANHKTVWAGSALASNANNIANIFRGNTKEPKGKNTAQKQKQGLSIGLNLSRNQACGFPTLDPRPM